MFLPGWVYQHTFAGCNDWGTTLGQEGTEMTFRLFVDKNLSPDLVCRFPFRSRMPMFAPLHITATMMGATGTQILYWNGTEVARWEQGRTSISEWSWNVQTFSLNMGNDLGLDGCVHSCVWRVCVVVWVSGDEA